MYTCILITCLLTVIEFIFKSIDLFERQCYRKKMEIRQSERLVSQALFCSPNHFGFHNKIRMKIIYAMLSTFLFLLKSSIIAYTYLNYFSI